MEQEVYAHFIGEDRFPDLAAEEAVARLSEAVRCRTVSLPPAPEPAQEAEFSRLRALMQKSYPTLMAAGRFEVLGRSVLITLAGRDPARRPALFMAHQDVVPVVRGTEADWLHEPFSGDVAEGFIWGRGSLDSKEMVFGLLEAAEYLLAHGRHFSRTVYFAFGEDEETNNEGAARIARHLQAEGVRLEFLLDEGDARLDSGAAYGAPETAVVSVGVAEKGYLDLELLARSRGGHSSDPWGGTSLGRLAKAIDAIQSHPFDAAVTPVLREAFRALSPFVTQPPLKALLRDFEKNEAAILAYCMGRRELYNQIVTTVAPTMIEGGSQACNVLPQDMRAVVNFRLSPGASAGAVTELCRRLAGPGVEAVCRQGNDASAVARFDGYGYHSLCRVLGEFFSDVRFIPTVSVGATDARRYECICDTCLRCCPFLEEAAIEHEGVHGTNERLSVRSYLQGIRCLITLLQETCL